VVDIVKAIKKSQILNAHFDSIRQINLCSKTLNLPVKTKWGSNLFCLTSIKVCKMSLQTLAVHAVGSTTEVCAFHLNNKQAFEELEEVVLH